MFKRQLATDFNRRLVGDFKKTFPRPLQPLRDFSCFLVANQLQTGCKVGVSTPLSIPKVNPLFDQAYTIEIEERLKLLIANTDLDSYTDILDNEITEEELKCVISKLKLLKAPGWDLIQNEHIIYGGDSIKKVLCILFNKVMELETIPDSWRKGIIIPIYKGHNKRKTSIDSYRPVTLLPVMLKIYEKLLYNRITSYLIAANIKFPNSQQQGFQPQLKPCSCAQFAPGCKFAPGSKFTPGCKFAPPCVAFIRQ